MTTVSLVATDANAVVPSFPKLSFLIVTKLPTTTTTAKKVVISVRVQSPVRSVRTIARKGGKYSGFVVLLPFFVGGIITQVARRLVARFFYVVLEYAKFS